MSSTAGVMMRSWVDNEKLLPEISARTMRLALYRGLAASGAKELDSLSTSIEWGRVTLIYSAMNIVEPLGVSRNMMLFGGYPAIFDSAIKMFSRNSGQETFRIYARTAATADDIAASSRILASHRGYVTSDAVGLKHFRDITGVFITKPGVAPKRVGIFGYEHFVDFAMVETTPIIKARDEEAYLIPGPPRISREETAAAQKVLSAGERADPGIADVVELMRMFGEDIPQFAIPIQVKGRGKLTGIVQGNEVPNRLVSPSGAAMASAAIAMGGRQFMGSGFSMRVPRFF